MDEKLNYYMGLPYRVEVVEDKQEGGYALHCPELPGCMTCADTIEQGFRMIEEAKREWFTACIEEGWLTSDDVRAHFRTKAEADLLAEMLQREQNRMAGARTFSTDEMRTIADNILEGSAGPTPSSPF